MLEYLDVFILLLLAFSAASWNGVRGSGLLKTEGPVLRFIQTPLKYFTTPLFLFGGVYYATSDWVPSIICTLPYYLKMLTGTGGDMQARRDNLVCNPQYMQEWFLFDKLALRLAETKLFNLPICQGWGVWYCTLWGVVFSLPFLLTNYLFSLPVLFYAVFVRYLRWRQVEFFYILTYGVLINLSAWALT